MGRNKAVQNPLMVSEVGPAPQIDDDARPELRLSPKVVGAVTALVLGGLLLLALALALGGGSEPSGGAAPEPAPTQNILELVERAPELSSLFTAISASRLTALFARQQNLTVFAPTNAAFAAMPPGTMDRLLEPANVDWLEFVLQYHVIASGPVVHSRDLHDAERIQMMEGESIEVTLLDGAVLLDQSHGQSRVVRADRAATNGVVHTIDTVLAPLEHPPAPAQNVLSLIHSVGTTATFSSFPPARRAIWRCKVDPSRE